MPHIATPERVKFLSFKRTFTLLIVLVVLPSAGVSGFGVVAIVNERAAVEKRLERALAERLVLLSRDFRAALQAAAEEAAASDEGLVLDFHGLGLSEVGFVLNGEVTSVDKKLVASIQGLGPEIAALPERPVVLSVASPQGSMLLAMRRVGKRVLGARLSGTAIGRLLSHLASNGPSAGERARFQLLPLKREPEAGVVARLVSGVSEVREAALGPPELASLTLPTPLQDFRIVAFSEGEDPVALASNRNRVLYAVLLLLFYVTLALGVVFTGRTLYREAQLSRLKTDFVSLVSHELRTPLTSIRLFIEMLASGKVKSPDEMQTVLTLLDKETTRLSQMIESVLNWARIESGRQTYRKERLDPMRVIETAVAAFRAQTLGAKMHFEVQAPATLPPLQADREALAGALLNLLQNAFKYSRGDKHIVLRAFEKGREIVFEVQDNGIGIPKSEQRRIFERFYRVDNLLSRETEGTGLGLAIAQRITQAHGGRLCVESTPNHGSTFSIHLPCIHD